MPESRDCSTGPTGLTAGVIGAVVAGLLAWKHQGTIQPLHGRVDGRAFVVFFMLSVGLLCGLLEKLWFGFVDLEQLKLTFRMDQVLDELEQPMIPEMASQSYVAELSSQMLPEISHSWRQRLKSNILVALRRGSVGLSCCGYPIRARQCEHTLTNTLLLFIYFHQLCIILFAYKTDILPAARDICTQYRWFSHHADYHYLDVVASWFIFAAQNMVLIDARNATMTRFEEQLSHSLNTSHGSVQGCELKKRHPYGDYFRMTVKDRLELFEGLPTGVWLMMLIVLLVFALGPCAGHAFHKLAFSPSEGEKEKVVVDPANQEELISSEVQDEIIKMIINEQAESDLQVLKKSIDEQVKRIDEQDKRIKEQDRKIEEQDRKIEEQDRKIDTLQQGRRFPALLR